MNKPIAKTRLLASKLVYAALSVLVEKGGQAPGKVVIDEVEKRVDLDSYALETYEKTGYTRWKSVLHFYTIDAIKAGFMLKKQGVWYITDEGEAALKYGEIELLNSATDAYKAWRAANPKSENNIESQTSDIDDESVSGGEQAQEATLQQMEQLAYDGLADQIDKMNAYELQDLVAALLRAMGYYTPFIAPKGKDGGLDVIAYQDALGIKSPRIKVQIKHRDAVATAHEIRALLGLLIQDKDVGMFVSTGGYSSDAKLAARHAQTHIELIDLDKLISLWQDFYCKLSDADKNRLRLKPVYFYDPLI